VRINILLIRRLSILILVCALAFGGTLAGACGGGDGMPRARTTGTGGTGARPNLPQVVTLGGPGLTNPKVLPIVYSTDSAANDLLAFLQELASTSYWGETTSEYGVGPLTVLPAVTLTSAPPPTVTDAALEAALADNTTGANPSWGAADSNTIYLFVLPAGSIEKDGEGACCTDYDGYHYEATAGGLNVPYAVSCACPMFDGPGVTDLQERTIDMSHELVESATDPFPDTASAYTQEDDADIVWTLVTDGEVADMCEFNDDANVIPPGSTYMVQRTWSNAAAQRFDNPCVPVVTTTPYLNSFPQLGTISYSNSYGTVTTQGLDVQLGASRTIDLTLVSASPVGAPWTVNAYDYDDVIVGAAPGTSLQQDATSGGDGSTLHLTITPQTQDSMIGGEAFIIWSDFGSPGDPDFESQLSMGLITNN
jgi:hypothetical protein